MSKLFPFLYTPIQIRYKIDYQNEDEVRESLEKVLDRIPDEVLPWLYRWDWWDFYEDTFRLELGPVLERLSERIQEFCCRSKENIPSESTTEGTEDLRRSRWRQPEVVERDSIIVHCLKREIDRFEICRVLDQKGVLTTPGLRAKGFHRWADAWTNTATRNKVQQVFAKARKK